MAVTDVAATPTPTDNYASAADAWKAANWGPTGTANGLTGDQNIAAVTAQTVPSTNVSYPTTPLTGPAYNPTPAWGTTPSTTKTLAGSSSTPFTSIVPSYSAPAGPPAPTSVVPNPTGKTDGSLHLNVNGATGTDVPVFKGTSFESGSDLAKQLGLDYKADPTTGEITIGGTKVMPTSYDKQGNAMVGVRQVANALGYQVGYDDKSKTITVTGKPPASTTGTGIDGVGDVNQGWQAPDMSGYQGNMMPYSTFNGDMNNYYTQAHAQLDAQYNQQKQALMDKQAADIKASDESMNKRGIYSSGVAQSVEDDLRTKTTQAVANVLSNQMAAVAKTAQGLYDTAYKQYQDGNTFALKNNQDNITNMLAVEKQSFNEYIQTHKLTDAEINAANAEFDKQAALIQKETQAELPYNNVKADTIANNQTKEDIALLPYKGMTAYQSMTTQEKATMDAAMIAAKAQGLTLDANKLAESIRHNTADETNTANGQAITKDHNAATETETNRHNTADEANAANKPASVVTVDPRKSVDNVTFYKSSLANPGNDANGKKIKVTNADALKFAQQNEANVTPTDYQAFVDFINATYKN